MILKEKNLAQESMVKKVFAFAGIKKVVLVSVINRIHVCAASSNRPLIRFSSPTEERLLAE